MLICICLSLSSPFSPSVTVVQLWPLSRYSCCYLGSLHPRNFHTSESVPKFILGEIGYWCLLSQRMRIISVRVRLGKLEYYWVDVTFMRVPSVTSCWTIKTIGGKLPLLCTVRVQNLKQSRPWLMNWAAWIIQYLYYNFYHSRWNPAEHDMYSVTDSASILVLIKSKRHFMNFI